MIGRILGHDRLIEKIGAGGMGEVYLADGVDFLVMEYIRGVTLSEQLIDGPHSESEVIRLGIQMAEGLEAGHKEGIVHTLVSRRSSARRAGRRPRTI